MAEKIEQICTAGEGGSLYAVGDRHVMSIEEFMVPGQYCSVSWFRVLYENGTTREVNGAFIEYVRRAARSPAEQEEKHG